MHSGRHGLPSDCSRTLPWVNAVPVRLFTTMSARSRARIRTVAFRDSGAEVVVGELGEALLSHRLAFAVRRHRVESAGLVNRLVASRAIERARRRESEDPSYLGHLRHVNCAVRVHTVGGLRIQVTDRVVGDRCEVNDGVEPFDVFRRHITNVPSPLFIACRLGAEVASVVPADVEADDLVAGCSQEWDEYRANVAAVASDEHPHNCLLMVVAGSSSDQLVIQDQLRVASDSVRGAIYFAVLVVVAMKKYWSETSLTRACRRQGHGMVS